MRYRVMNLTRNTLLAEHSTRAETFFSRFKGLIGVPHLPFGEGLHLTRCNSIHTFFMKMPIDVLFLDVSHHVVDICPSMPPWGVSRVYFNAKSVLELPHGTASASQTQVGDLLDFTPNE